MLHHSLIQFGYYGVMGKYSSLISCCYYIAKVPSQSPTAADIFFNNGTFFADRNIMILKKAGSSTNFEDQHLNETPEKFQSQKAAKENWDLLKESSLTMDKVRQYIYSCFIK